MLTKLLLGLLGALGIIIVLERVSTVVDETSEWVSERLGVLTLRVVTLGRHPRSPLSPNMRMVTGILGVSVFVAFGLMISYMLASGGVTKPQSQGGDWKDQAVEVALNAVLRSDSLTAGFDPHIEILLEEHGSIWLDSRVHERADRSSPLFSLELTPQNFPTLSPFTISPLELDGDAEDNHVALGGTAVRVVLWESTGDSVVTAWITFRHRKLVFQGALASVRMYRSAKAWKAEVEGWAEP